MDKSLRSDGDLFCKKVFNDSQSQDTDANAKSPFEEMSTQLFPKNESGKEVS